MPTWRVLPTRQWRGRLRDRRDLVGPSCHARDSNHRHREEKDISLQLSVPIHSFAAPPRWFPDGQSVLVAALRPHQSGIGFYRVDLSGGKTELLQHTKKEGIAAMQPDLSEEGKTIFYARNDDGSTELMRFDIETRSETAMG